jgi:hypothetical protein
VTALQKQLVHLNRAEKSEDRDRQTACRNAAWWLSVARSLLDPEEREPTEVAHET